MWLVGFLYRIFGHEGTEAGDIVYVNWLNMVRAGVMGLEFYSPETRKWGQVMLVGERDGGCEIGFSLLDLTWFGSCGEEGKCFIHQHGTHLLLKSWSYTNRQQVFILF